MSAERVREHRPPDPHRAARSAHGTKNPGAAWPFVGRPDEMSLAVAAVESHQSRGVVIAGASGTGKSRLAQEVVREVDTGMHVEWVSATAASRSVPFGAFARLVPDVGRAPWNTQLEAIRCVTESLLARAAGRPLLLVVDDAHWLDPAAAAAVEFFVSAGAGHVLLTVGAGAAATDQLVSLWKDEVTERVDLGPLGQSDVETLLRHALNGQVDALAARRLWELSAGYPMFLRELVLGLRDSQSLVVDGDVRYLVGDVPITNRVALIVEEQLAGLDEGARGALDVLAIGEPLPLEALRRLVPDDAIDRVERAAMISTEADENPEYRLAQPMYREVLRRSLSRLERRAIKARLAVALADHSDDARNLIRVARWAADSAVSIDGARLVTASRLATAAGDPELGERLARLALEGEGCLAAGVALGVALNGMGRFAEGEAVLRSLAADAETDQARVEVAIARYRGLTADRGHRRELDRVLCDTERQVTDVNPRMHLRAERATSMAYRLQLDGALALACRPGHGEPDEKRELRELRAFGTAALLQGRPVTVAAVAERLQPESLRHQAEQPEAPYWVISVRMQALVLAGELDEADRQMNAIEELTALAGPSIARLLGLGRGIVALRRGQPRTARRLLLGDGSGPPHRLAHAYLAEACALLGDLEGAQLASKKANEVSMFVPAVEGLARRAAAWAAYALNERTRAADVALAAATWSRHHGAHGGELLALHDALRFGAALAARPLAVVAARCEGPWAACLGTHARAVSTADGVELDAVAHQFELLGALLLAAEAGSQATTAHQRAGLDARSTRSRARVGMLANACEGARSPELEEGALPSHLTRREKEVAILAAQGLTDRAIAERLVVAMRTVEGHLYRIYSKVGVRDRRQLAHVLKLSAPGTGGVGSVNDRRGQERAM